jgi:hypothetical protein
VEIRAVAGQDHRRHNRNDVCSSGEGSDSLKWMEYRDGADLNDMRSLHSIGHGER